MSELYVYEGDPDAGDRTDPLLYPRASWREIARHPVVRQWREKYEATNAELHARVAELEADSTTRNLRREVKGLNRALRTLRAELEELRAVQHDPQGLEARRLLRELQEAVHRREAEHLLETQRLRSALGVRKKELEDLRAASQGLLDAETALVVRRAYELTHAEGLEPVASALHALAHAVIRRSKAYESRKGADPVLGPAYPSPFPLLAVLARLVKCPLCLRWTGETTSPTGLPIPPQPHAPSCPLGEALTLVEPEP